MAMKERPSCISSECGLVDSKKSRSKLTVEGLYRNSPAEGDASDTVMLCPSCFPSRAVFSVRCTFCACKHIEWWTYKCSNPNPHMAQSQVISASGNQLAAYGSTADPALRQAARNAGVAQLTWLSTRLDSW